MAALVRPTRTVKPPSYKYDLIPSAMSSSNSSLTTNEGSQRRPRKDSRQQNSYHPGKDMTKEELSEWRAAERKKRNRLAAAASRNKLRKEGVTLAAPAAKRPRKSAKHQQRQESRFTDSPYSTITLSSDEGYYSSSSSLDTPLPAAADPLYSHPSGPSAGPSPFSSPYPYPSQVINAAQPSYYSYQAGVPHQSPYVSVVGGSSFFSFDVADTDNKPSFNNVTKARHSSACSNGFITRDAHTVVI